jgi:hypothetical protein
VSKVPVGVDAQQLSIVARRVLLNGLEALGDHLDAITVVGAQAVYLRSADVPIAAAAYTSDGDLGLDPCLLEDEPLLGEALRSAGFELLQPDQPGLWGRAELIHGVKTSVELDLLIGSSLVNGGRGARIPPHDKNSVRRVEGIETAVVDRSRLTIGALDEADERQMSVHVAGPAALLVAKAHKLKDRFDASESKPHRLIGKDAGDVYRLMVASHPADVADSFRSLIANDRVGTVTTTGLRYLYELFGGAETPGVRLATSALAGDVPAARIRTLAPAFVRALPSPT